MNTHTHRTIYNRARGCLMAVAETAHSSGKASGSARPGSKSKSQIPTCRKARSALCSGGMWLQANQGLVYSLPCLQSQYKNNPSLADKVDWKKIDEAHKNWSYDKTSMTPAMAAVVSLAVAYASGGTLSNLAAVAAGSMGGGAAMTAAMQAGMSVLLSQASVALINNGGDLGKTLEQLGSSDSLKGLALSMVTAGALQGLSDYLPKDIANATAKSPFTDQLTRNLINNAASATIRSALTGTSLEDNLKSSIVDAIITTGMAQGANAIGDAASQGKINEFGRAVAHAVAGCIAGTAKAGSGDGCSAGALGAVVGELAAGFYNGDTGDGTGQPKADTVQFAALISGVAGALVGGDAQSVNLAAGAGANSAANNYLLHPDRTALQAAKAKLSASIEECNLACKESALKEVSRLVALDKENDAKWKAACDANPSSPECTSQTKYKELDLGYQGELSKQQEAADKAARVPKPAPVVSVNRTATGANDAAGLLPASNGGIRSAEDIANSMENISRGAGIVSSSATAAAAVPGPHQPVAAGTALGATVVGFVADGVQQVVKPDVGKATHDFFLNIAQTQIDNKLPLIAPFTNEVKNLWVESGTALPYQEWVNSRWDSVVKQFGSSK